MTSLPGACPCCGARHFAQQPVVWQELVDAWELSSDEAAMIDLQQGWHCTTCGNNLRAMALAPRMLRKRREIGRLRRLSPGEVRRLILAHRLPLRETA